MENRNDILEGVKTSIFELSGIIKHYISVKHRQDYTGIIINACIVVVVIGCITALALLHVLESSVTGALLASVIGYTVGRSQNTGGKNGKVSDN